MNETQILAHVQGRGVDAAIERYKSEAAGMDCELSVDVVDWRASWQELLL